jgi:signal peptidase II
MQGTRGKRPALTDRRSHLRLWLTAGGGLATDLATKALAWRLLGPPPAPSAHGAPRDVIPGVLQLVTSLNPGIVFGLDFARDLGLAESWGRAATILLTLLACLFILYVFAGTRPEQKWLHAMGGLVLAGALGNLYDRLAFGHVRDFLQITLKVRGGAVWPYVFNVADVYLVIGVVALGLGCFFGGRDGRTTRPGASAAEGVHGRP